MLLKAQIHYTCQVTFAQYSGGQYKIMGFGLSARCIPHFGMLFSDPEKRRRYTREYMRRRGAGSIGRVKPQQDHAARPPKQSIDRSRPYTVDTRYPFPAYLVQDGIWFDPKTGELVGPACA